MSRSRKGRDVHGVLLLDKPLGYSSSQAVQKVRWLFKARKAGHTGSLDPFASGMLPICLGEASKTAGFMLDAPKTYLACARLGQASTTGDTEGDITLEQPVPDLESADIERVFSLFRGEIRQVPPMYSALKHQGQRLYRLAREGREVERETRRIKIHTLDLVSWDSPQLVFRVRCSKGTYVRTLAEDLALALGSCAHLKALRRLEVGPFSEDGLVTLGQLEQAVEDANQDSLLLPLDAGLSYWPVLVLQDADRQRFLHGNAVTASSVSPGNARVYDRHGQILGLAEVQENRVYPKRVFVFGTRS